MRLREEEWEFIQPLLPRPKVRKDGKGRPRRGNREVLEGILWVLKTGARWCDLPLGYPPYQTCHRRFQDWQNNGVIDKILEFR
jgi:transposase